MKTTSHTSPISRITVATLFLLGLLSVVPQSALAWNLQGSCVGVPSSVSVGDSVLWSATQTSTMLPHEGHYEWVWSGTNGLSGTSQTLAKTYTTPGIKNATVVISMVLDMGLVEKITRSCQITVTAPPPQCVLEITKTVDKTTAQVGDILTYTIEYKNTGTANCTGSGVKVQDVVDPHLNFIAETHSANVIPGYVTDHSSVPLYQTANRTLTWHTSTLTPGQSASITWTGEITAPLLCGSFHVDNKASVTSIEYANFTTWVHSNTVRTNVTNTCPPLLDGSCTIAPVSANIGDPVTFSATASGGTGTYSYTWAGTDGLSGVVASILKTYTSIGTKTGTVTIVSGSDTITRSCTIDIGSVPPPQLIGSCTANPTSTFMGTPVTFSSSASGGTGTYTYAWSGTDGLSGTANSVVKSYTTVGNKQATVVITSGSNSVTATCDTSVTSISIPSFSASCSVSPASIRTGESVQWAATASGGTGTYAYTWSGTDGLSGTTQTVDKTYASAGSKSAMVTVTSGSNTISTSCELNVLPPPGCTQNCGGGGFNPPTVVLLKKPPVGQVLSAIYLSQIPYTGFGDWYKIALFILVLALWSAAAVYFFRSKLWKQKLSLRFGHSPVSPIAQSSLADEVMEIKTGDSLNEEWMPYDTHQTSRPTVSVPTDDLFSITNGTTTHMIQAGILDVIASEAQRKRVVISEEGMKLVASQSGYDANTVLSLLDTIIGNAEKTYDREDGWLLLNKEKISSSLSSVSPVSASMSIKEPAPVPVPAPAPVRVVPPVSPMPPAQKNPVTYSQPVSHGTVDTALFVEWLSSGDTKQVAHYLKQLREQSAGVGPFLKKVILDLDLVYRARFDEVDEQVSDRLVRTVATIPNEQLEQLIGVLISSMDQKYRSASLGVKIALLRAEEVGKMHR
ncbi:MAG: hypothetical protein A2664_00350 [Candidatus Taylorbacteria bacterium RIFCSPHIGHO2_01_FULL_46_22b]|uniref:PKD domain-containing protein n=1 Tax=Candidatus Taylorbacteria bacterium RIFCSPHIGHO2_01_FULL_46_22b TaxID=1802301 RepID=A0A1G2M4H1_9BACT|nr:MAG: hypothetical protein A2664_00350 [Candidatus Taylorbacteria bacterium RIFCSPHIGHO2_01_FULL_46_22b]